MNNIVTPSSLSEAEQDIILNQLFGEMQQLNAQMRDDQADIERLKVETRLISAHSDQLLLQIEAQLDALRKAS
jgi:hypothetical protein